jgi:FMN-dependent NADH-azoreductase
MTLLHIDSSILGTYSVSRKLSADIVARLTAAAPGTQVVYRDLGASPVPHLSGATLAAARSEAPTNDPAIAADLALGGEVMAEFLAAETLVIGVAFYNFTIPSQLKAWLDRIIIAGVTFRYGADGRPEGLVGNKRVVLAIARGGVYAPGAPAASFEHAETYLRATLAFLGITHPEVVIAEGVAAGPEQRQLAIEDAERNIASLAA